MFGEDRVFMDVEDISPGKNFAEAIDQTIATCDSALVVIGPRWMEIFDQRSRQNQIDYVSHEVSAALARKITVIPVLVGGAGMGQLAALPPKLAGLALLQAAELRNNTFKQDCIRLAQSLGAPSDTRARIADTQSRKKPWLLAASAVALLFLLFGIIGIGPWSEYRARKATIQRVTATAKSQMDRTEYEAAFRTYQDALKADPTNEIVMDLQADAAMRWLENFHVIVGEGQKAEDIAGPTLATLMPVLDAALARTDGKASRAADILAHTGWAHWLNQKLAQKEFGNAAERDLRQALKIDPSNVFANAMLGNLLLQTHGDTKEALKHLDTAVSANKERPLVRQMQLGGMISNYDEGIRPALIQVANQMRQSSEPIGDRSRRRILNAFNPGLNSAEELEETLTAVSPKDTWETYLWLESKASDRDELERQKIQRQFLQASLLEIQGKPADALAAFQSLERELKAKGLSGRIANHTTQAIQRLGR